MEHAFLQAFQQYWQAHFVALQPHDTQLIVALSGGVDSVVLAHILHHLGFDFTIAHCNFHLRGEESNRDEAFVRQYAQRMGKPFLCKEFDTAAFAKEARLGMEEAARDLRYGWFRQLAHEKKTSDQELPILVAHHANDSVETVFMNFFRGCGISGLHGILPIKEGIYRPLLFAKRNDIVRYALSRQLSWIEDATNMDEKYTRNFLRHNIVPELKNCFPTIEDNILGNMERFRDVETLYNEHIALLKKKLLQETGGNHELDIATIKRQNALPTVVYELFKDFGFSSRHTAEILKLLDAESGARLESSSHTIWKDRFTLIVSSKQEYATEEIIWNETDEKTLPDGTVWSKELSEEGNMANSVSLDYDTLQFPLVIRHWKEGDEFYPSGMQGKKKLAKYFIDQKIPTPLKHRIWIVTSAGRIVWIAGYRADRRFVAKEKTARSYHLTYTQPL